MNELTFGRVEDGNIIAVDPTGAEFALPITDQVRSAVRQARLGQAAQETELEVPEVLRPKDIQALVRAGASPEELSLRAGLDLDHVNRYAAPVMDERAFIAQRARGLVIGRDAAAPTLEQLTLDRLAERGVDPATLVWDAARQRDEWVVRVDFESSEGPSRARWHLDVASGALTPLDDQARWITAAAEPDSPVPPVRLLGAVPGGLAAVDEAVPAASPLSLLDNLNDARGLRDPVAPLGTSLDALGGDADVLELRRDEEFSTEAVSYLEPEPLDTAGNPITFLRDPEEAADLGPLPEPALPPEPLPEPPPADPNWGQPTHWDQADQLAPEPRRVRQDVIWEGPAPELAADPEPQTDRASIWARSTAGARDQEQGELFEAAPVEPADQPPPLWQAQPPTAASPPQVFSPPPAQAAPVEAAPEPEPEPEPAPPPRSRSAAKRSSVPSWDEIVFGAARTDS
ncbi:MAG: DUF3071 domain-containing protein [Bifidobacteriaceae bacterium]|jgi:hypothetical protein|nr:DUF3071 domain-containing protein [Bifidobacteriaceae bacterium]